MAHYFVHLPPNGSPAIFWRRLAGFAGELIHINLNLLAHAVGDDPAQLVPGGGALVTPQDYVRFSTTSTGTTVIPVLQPFAFTTPGGGVEALPITGTKLEGFLNDPLSGERMDLSLPFYDEDIKLLPTGGGWFRNSNDDGAFHAGMDFGTSPRAVFDVCAAAKGRILAMAGDSIILSHTTTHGREFRTVYDHIDLSTVSHDVGDSVRSGELLGRTDAAISPIQLHFGVAVQVSDGLGSLNGVQISEFWYFMDPWGVYEFRDNNYLPTTGRIFESPIVGAAHTIQWRAQPVFKTIPIARSTDGYRDIIRVQLRVREGTNLGGTFPTEQEQFLVWLGDDPDFFLVPLTQTNDRAMELELVTLLREAFFTRRRVRLEYRYAGDLRYIMAAWVNA
jgi:murein DD-endopeptidase MepM/ murein hydrolase activator NlpD